MGSDDVAISERRALSRSIAVDQLSVHHVLARFSRVRHVEAREWAHRSHTVCVPLNFDRTCTHPRDALSDGAVMLASAARSHNDVKAARLRPSVFTALLLLQYKYKVTRVQLDMRLPMLTLCLSRPSDQSWLLASYCHPHAHCFISVSSCVSLRLSCTRPLTAFVLPFPATAVRPFDRCGERCM